MSKLWLVLIGIDFYPNPACRLRGAVNDVKDVDLYLRDRFNDVETVMFLGPTPEDTSKCLPPGPEHLWPTFDNITTAFRQIVQKAGPGDIVYVHYSGHGTICPTKQSGFEYTEDYGTDAALVLLEPKAQQRVRYLRGIELALLLDDIVKSGVRLTVVLDSCHSGGVSRGEYGPARGMLWDAKVDAEFPLVSEALAPSSDSKKQVFRDAVCRNHWLLHPRGYALLTACGPHEVARELHLGKERYNGAFSYHVLEALAFCYKNKIENVTHDVIHRRLCSRMYAKVIGQNPVFIGTKSTLFLGKEASNGNTSSDCEVVKVFNNQKIWLNAGLIHGVNTGDKYDVYIPWIAKKDANRVVVTDVQAVHSVAEPISTRSPEQTQRPIEVGFFAVLVALAKPRAYVKQSLGAEEPLRQMLCSSVWLEPLFLKDMAPIDLPCFLVTVTEKSEYEILDVHKRKIPNLPSIMLSDKGARESVMAVLEHLAKFAFVEALGNNKTNSLAESDFTIDIQAKDDSTNVLREGCIEVPDESTVCVTFGNRTCGVLYFTVLNLMPLRKIKKLYPSHKECQVALPHEPADVLPHDTTREIKSSGTICFRPQGTIPKIIKDNGGVQAEDILKFIVSNSAIRGTSSMELPDLWDQVNKGRDSGDSAFGSLFEESFGDSKEHLSQLRGEQVPAKWACRSVTIRTVLNKDSKIR
ncbi:hypothetical protein MMC30_007664 [Trapelia coarctata]|nr:hypothetical protein [Trapelia coarctata]